MRVSRGESSLTRNSGIAVPTGRLTSSLRPAKPVKRAGTSTLSYRSVSGNGPARRGGEMHDTARNAAMNLLVAALAVTHTAGPAGVISPWRPLISFTFQLLRHLAIQFESTTNGP